MNFLSFDLRKFLLGLFIAAIPLVMLNIDKNPEDTAWYKIPFSFAAGVIQTGYNNFATSVEKTTNLYLDLVGLNKKMAGLQKESERLKVELQRLQEMELENSRMRELLQFGQMTPMSLVSAQVVAKDISAEHYTVVIDKGTRQGIKKRHGVVSVNGVVGFILDAREDTSQVLLLTDRMAAIDAIVQRTRARAISKGRNKTSCRLQYLERADNVKSGDVVVTSGLNGYFPKGFPLGRVTSVRRTEYGISQEAFVEPSVDPSKLEEVFVITNSNNVDFSTLFGPSNLIEQEKKIEPPGAKVGGNN